MIWGSDSQKGQEIFLFSRSLNWLWDHPSSYSGGTGDCFPADNVTCLWTWHPPLFNADFKNEWTYTSTPPYACMPCIGITLLSSLLYVVGRHYLWHKVNVTFSAGNACCLVYKLIQFFRICCFHSGDYVYCIVCFIKPWKLMYRKQVFDTFKYGIRWSGVNLLEFETSWIQRLLTNMPFLSHLCCFLCEYEAYMGAKRQVRVHIKC
jgi:hypothetical protein